MNKTPHPYAEVLRWIADGESIQKDTAGVFSDLHINDVLVDVINKRTGHFRIKPKTIRIGEFDVPEPERVELKNGQLYYIPVVARPDRVLSLSWHGSYNEENFLKCGLIHLKYESAALHARALISFTQNNP